MYRQRAKSLYFAKSLQRSGTGYLITLDGSVNLCEKFCYSDGVLTSPPTLHVSVAKKLPCPPGGGGGGHSPWFWVPTAKWTVGAVVVNLASPRKASWISYN